MTDPTSRPTPAITSDDGLAPIGAWAVHRAPGHGHEPPILARLSAHPSGRAARPAPFPSRR